jgi:hypothetical protein
MKESE